ncbi:MAG TPA: DUF5996 family protein [Steroidobacter sp.]|nr:DUF5996 family protein [Steroidobacteraceae bacterium]HLS82921.1 DUF5996 family protein [Steroidobacter sp.]
MRSDASSQWPALPYGSWRDTCGTLHLWLQVVGKIPLALCPWINHSWHVALQPTARGLATRLMSYGGKALQIEFDFVEHRLIVRLADDATRSLPLEPQSTASFYRKVMSALDELGVPVRIYTTPSELPDPVPFDQDEVHGSYDREYANRYWRVLVQAHRVFEEFRARFIGKCSPVHYFWGSADLAVTRFSGRTAPPHPGGVPHLPDWVAREAYSHEVSSAGFWAGGEQHPHPIFYSYAYPEPPGFSAAKIAPQAAYFSDELKEFVLPYDSMRAAPSPEAALTEFLQSTYEAATELGSWDRQALERPANVPPTQ